MCNIFPLYTSSAYCMGSLNSDCWYMYTMKDFSRPSITSEPDQTIEILMSELDTEIMDIFHQHTSTTAKEAREVRSFGREKMTQSQSLKRRLYFNC